MKTHLDFVKKMPSLFFGLFLFALGIVANLYSGLGMNPWGVLNVGIEKQTALTLGQASQLVGLIILIIGWLLGFAPGFGTISNMYFIGIFIDEIIKRNLMPRPQGFLEQIIMLFVGIILLGAASYFYLRVELGAGPRDGLMMGLTQKINKPVWIIRGVLETTALIAGYLLGGPVGIGTIITALTIGLSVQLAFKIGRYDSKNSSHMNLIELLKFLTKENLS